MSLKDTLSNLKEAAADLADQAKDKGFDFADRAVKGGADLAERAKDKAKRTARVAKLNMDIRSEENAINRNYTEIGRLYYETYGSEPEGFLQQLCREIDSATDNIARMETEIAALKAGADPDNGTFEGNFEDLADVVEDEDAAEDAVEDIELEIFEQAEDTIDEATDVIEDAVEEAVEAVRDAVEDMAEPEEPTPVE